MTCHGVQPIVECIEYLQKQNVISKATLKKIKCSSLLYNHLRLAFEREGFDGVIFLLIENTSDGKTRVSSNYKVAKKVADFFASLQ